MVPSPRGDSSRNLAAIRVVLDVKVLLSMNLVGNPDHPAELHAGFSGDGNALCEQRPGNIGHGTTNQRLAQDVSRATTLDRRFEFWIYGDAIGTTRGRQGLALTCRIDVR
jgi:hypothetical protein